MTNGTKLIIGILAIVAIGIGISTAMETEESKGKSNTVKNNTSSMQQYMENTGKEEIKKNNTVENDKVVENKVEEKVEEEVEEEVVGKEEVESKEENVGLNNKEKAIKLAQDEWAISINSYDFQAELQNDGTYKVTVRSNDSNRTTVAIYNVNVENETVTEI